MNSGDSLLEAIKALEVVVTIKRPEKGNATARHRLRSGCGINGEFPGGGRLRLISFGGRSCWRPRTSNI